MTNQTDPLDEKKSLRTILIDHASNDAALAGELGERIANTDKAVAAISAEIAKAVREATKVQNYYCNNCNQRMLLMDLAPKLEEDGE